MYENDNDPSPASESLEQTLHEILASELILDGRNGQGLKSTVENVISDLLVDTQLQKKLMSETKVGFGMALGKFLAWKIWTDIEKSDKSKAASRFHSNSLTLKVPEAKILEVKERWPAVRSAFLEQVGFALPEPTLEVGDEIWCLEIKGGLLEARAIPEDWPDALLTLLRDQAPRLLTLSLVKQLVDKVRIEEPVIGEELERLRLPLTVVYRVLESLLEESISIKETEVILTAIILNWESRPDKGALLSAVRKALSPWICKSLQVSDGVLRAIKLGRRIEDTFAESLRYLGSEQVFALDPKQKALIGALVKQALLQLGNPEGVVLLTNHRMRQEIQSIIARQMPGLPVLADSEIHQGFRVEVLARVDFKEPKKLQTLPSERENEVSLP